MISLKSCVFSPMYCSKEASSITRIAQDFAISRSVSVMLHAQFEGTGRNMHGH
jgi:hypothetical protein